MREKVSREEMGGFLREGETGEGEGIGRDCGEGGLEEV